MAGSNQDSADQPQAQALAYTSRGSWAESNLRDATFTFNPSRDRQGPIAVAAAVERGPGANIDVRIRPSRLVVFGDVGFVSNGGLTGGDMDFFMSALNWLLEREELIAISSRPITETRILLNKNQRHTLFWLDLALLPAGIVFIGIAVWLRRRS